MPVEKLENDHTGSSTGSQDAKGPELTVAENGGGGGSLPANKSATRLNILKKNVSKASMNKKKPAADDPFRFQGDGVDFKAKLIGVREVLEARGDQMCQDAMQLCKASVKNTGQHKQRITLNISLEGLKIKDEKTQTVLYQFPVAKISFICRDVTDARAFGFVFGTADAKHKFYGIKTAQTADQTVLSIRDMFHIVFDMKKKQMEVARKSIEGPLPEPKDVNENDAPKEPEVADLLDLQSELDNLQQGMNQMATWGATDHEGGSPANDGANFDPRGTNGAMLSSVGAFAAEAKGHDFFTSSGSYSNTSSGGISFNANNSASLNESIASSNTTNTVDPFGGDAFCPPTTTSQNGGSTASPWGDPPPPTVMAPPMGSPPTVLAPPPPAMSALSPDPFDTSHVMVMMASTPLSGNAPHPIPPPTTNGGGQLQIGGGDDWSRPRQLSSITGNQNFGADVAPKAPFEAPSSVFSSPPNGSMNRAFCASNFDQTSSTVASPPEVAWAPSGGGAPPLLPTRPAGGTNTPPGKPASPFGSVRTDSPTTLDDAFKKLVNVDALMGGSGGGAVASSAGVAPMVARGASPDPFAGIRASKGPSINEIRGGGAVPGNPFATTATQPIATNAAADPFSDDFFK